MRLKQVVGSAMIVDSYGKILYGRKIRGGKCTPPGGKIQSGETVKQGLAREIHEEVNLRVRPEDMDLLGFCDMGGKVIFFYLISKWSGRLENKEPDKHRDWEWIAEAPQDCVDGLEWFNEKLRAHMLAKIKEIWG